MPLWHARVKFFTPPITLRSLRVQRVAETCQGFFYKIISLNNYIGSSKFAFVRAKPMVYNGGSR